MASGGVLLSSPVRAHTQPLVMLSSSPELPSVNDLIPKPAKRPPLRSGSRAAPIPDDAQTNFTSASSLWRSLANDDDDAVLAIDRSDQAREPLKPKEKNALLGTVIDLCLSDSSRTKTPVETLKKPSEKTTKRTTKAKKARVPEIPPVAPPSTPPTDKPWRKFKSPQGAESTSAADAGEPNPPEREAKGPSAGRKPRKKKSETVSRHFEAKVIPAELVEIEDSVPSAPILALKRRTDWTPPKNTTPSQPGINPPAAEEAPSSAHLDAGFAPGQQGANFRDLLETYACKKGELSWGDSDEVAVATDVLGKRKQIDLITTGASGSREASPEKTKAPKKKARTITELATAAYRVDQDADGVADAGQAPAASLLAYFGNEDQPQPQNADGVSKGKKKAPRKPAKPRASKKAEASRPILLSPESAMKEVSRQDFVFGTSSQLAREHDTDMLRDLQEAIRLSNQEQGREPRPDTGALVGSRGRFGSRLWTAGARDMDGDLLEVEVIDLVHSPTIPKDLTNPAVISSLVRDSATQKGTSDSETAPRIPSIEILDAESPPLRPLLPASFSSGHASHQEDVSDESSAGHRQPAGVRVSSVVSVSSFDEEPPASNQEHNRLIEETHAVRRVGDLPEKKEPRERPKYELYTDAQLAKELQSYGFKPVKKRSAMITLLDQCWASKMKTVSATDSSTTGVKPAEPSAAPRRGRPRKDTAARADADDHGPNRGRRRPKRPASPPSCELSKEGPPRRKHDSTSSVPLQTGTSVPAPPPLNEAPSTPKRHKTEIADSDLDDPFLFTSPASSSLASLPDEEAHLSCPSVRAAAVAGNGEDTADLSLAASPTQQQTALFRFISMAVTTAPRSTDPTAPSWHEKMLLYDPVVLEDLTSWLNAGQLDRVGYDGEVAPAEVKKWCESKSVCCVWRFNLNGKERKRF